MGGMSRHLRRPGRTVRLRLTLLYGGFFLVCGCGLVAITYLFADHASSGSYTYGYTEPDGHRLSCGISGHPAGTVAGAAAPAARSVTGPCGAMALAQHAWEMHLLLACSGIALAITTVIAFALGWLVAGRVLRPLQTMTLATQRITERNLHERLALAGPDDELKRLADTIDDLLGRLEWAFDAQRRFVADRPVMVLMLTAADAAEERVSGLGLGADDYLAKPFHFGELVLRIRALARRQPAARPRIHRAAGIELDPQRRTATRDGRPLDLSVKEFAVLEALLRARPAVLSAEDLLQQVWDEHADPFTNTVFVTISRLRRKLGGPPVIQTQPGAGYHIS